MEDSRDNDLPPLTRFLIWLFLVMLLAIRFGGFKGWALWGKVVV